ncbi:WecB/TagA/CpsF family glycosyltransferase [Mucilaginibacter rubeus]|uniref:WecB/TagA/CpsF family glycosyltransferase n=1 Tax=Mucilaginibacter rubeus TaxID=2027860 RepID=A0A5C1I2A1_9SPHI|nr:WecB/TagA/CpsF family glycosyltransferase [Mucilaginibacter rubeus]QEM11989.1 WecB/TagA/CpsF family glycosyltransferase [Mucilaginibacter rubeus]
MKKRTFISLKISVGKYSEFINEIIDLALLKKSSYVCVANVHMLIEAYNDDNFADVVNNADIVTPDGMPLALAIKFKYGTKQDRVDGMSLLPDLIKEATQKDVSVYFYGGTEEAIKQTRDYLDQHYPNLRVAGMYSPPFRPLTSDEEEVIVKNINDSGAQILFVALGCPKQERWMASMKGRVNCVMVGIGGALPVFVGLQKRAPVFLQKLSLEWLFRLFQEPKRLFKRYFLTNTLFIYLVSKKGLKRIFIKNN